MGRVVGIDLGTTGSRVACMIDGKPMIIENAEGNGTTPSTVAFKKGALPLVGEAAERYADTLPQAVIHAAKRLVGRRYADPVVQHLKDSLAYEIVEADGGAAYIQVYGSRYSPEHVCSLILRQLRETASRYLGEDITDAVISIPVSYNQRQKFATIAAARAAGLNILRTVSEPTAAALHHGFSRTDHHMMAIYDIGGGTFDVSILESGDGVVEVKAIAGDQFLGGEDIDSRIQRYFVEQTGIRLDSMSSSSLWEFKQAAIRAKVALCSQTEASISISSIGNHNVVITRDILQDISQDLIDRTLSLCADALNDSGYRKNEIDRVILVGGTTRLSFVEECVSRFFDQKIDAGSRREDTVALGCAIEGGVLGGDVKDILLLNVVPFSLGIKTQENHVEHFICKNTTIPTKKTRDILIDNSDTNFFAVDVYEGESHNPSECFHIGRIDLKFSESSSDNPQLYFVTFDVDGDSILKVSIRNRNLSFNSDLIFDEDHFLKNEKIISGGYYGELNTDINIFRTTKIYPTSQDCQSISKEHLKILAVGTEWKSGNGGLSTLNRQLCSTLSATNHDVICLVLEASAQEVQAAQSIGVRLIGAPKSPGQSEQVSLARRPKLPPDWVPDVVIGHGRVTGPAAAALVEDHFPTAKRLHFIHMAPDEIEWHKLDRGDDVGARAEMRTSIERELGMSATRVVAIGPRLFNRFATELHPYDCPSPLRLDPGFDADGSLPLSPPPGQPWRILLLGRAEDELLKGLDIAACAIGRVVARRGAALPSLEMVVRGARPDTSVALRDRLIKWSQIPSIKINVIPFAPAMEKLDADYRRASLVLMPSRSEGFGLVGLEAITAGVPVLVSSESGLGELLTESLAPELVNRIVVNVTGEIVQDGDAWARAIEFSLLDRDASFKAAETLRNQLCQEKRWKESVGALLAAIQN